MIFLEATKEADAYFEDRKKSLFEVYINVGNSTCAQDGIKIIKVKHQGYVCYQLLTNGNPKVSNRRMHPRLPMNNACDILLKTKNVSMKGAMNRGV